MSISVVPFCSCADFRNFHEIIPNVTDLSIGLILTMHTRSTYSNTLYQSVKELNKMNCLSVLRFEKFLSLEENILYAISDRSFHLKELHLNEFLFNVEIDTILQVLRNANELTLLNFKWAGMFPSIRYTSYDVYVAAYEIIKKRESRLPLCIKGLGPLIVRDDWLKMF